MNYFGYLSFLLIKFICGRMIVEHNDNNTSLYSVQDPGLLLVNSNYPDKPLTVFDYDSDGERLPVGLHEISEKILIFQIWHSYHVMEHKRFWLELEFDHNFKLSSEANSLQADIFDKKPSLNAVRIGETKYFKIKANKLCLTAGKKKSELRDAIAVKFMDCNENDDYQSFAFISKMKALCVIGSDLCPDNKEHISAAEKIVEDRLSYFAL